jgi:hypothetical protein
VLRELLPQRNDVMVTRHSNFMELQRVKNIEPNHQGDMLHGMSSQYPLFLALRRSGRSPLGQDCAASTVYRVNDLAGVH